MKIKPGICVALLCVLCLGLGMAAGYGLAVYAGNNAHSADSDLLCAGGIAPDKNGCCPGEVYTDMADLGFNCCPDNGGDCFPPIR